MPQQTAEQLAASIATMERPDLVRALHAIDCPFELDFTEEYLSSLSVERLRHLVLAACLHRRAAGR
jgi:hypothetical protein